MNEPFEKRLMRAIKPLGRTEAERAARLGYTVRAIDFWAEGKGLAARLKRLEDAGIIRLVDPALAPADLPATDEQLAA